MSEVNESIQRKEELTAPESYSQVAEEIREKIEKRALDFYKENPDKIGDIFSMLREEAQRHLVTASIEAGSEPTPEERQKMEAASDEPLSEDKYFTYDAIFSDDALRTRLYLALGTYLNLLRELAPDTFQHASDFLENCIINKKRLATEWGKQLGISPKSITKNKPAVLNITTRRAKEAIFGVSKVEGVAFDEDKNDFLYNDVNPVSIWVGTLKKRRVETIVSIDFNEMKKLGVTFTNEQRLNPFDREVHNATATLYAAGNKYITPQMIWGALSGNRTDAKMPPEARKKILDSIDKLRHSDIVIDASAEVRVGWNKKAKYIGALIPSERIEIISLNGQEVVDCIHLFRNPPLYDYANNKNQIGRVDIRMLDAPLNNTSENIELRGYLLRHITSAKNARSGIKPIIRYDTLYEYLRVDASSKDALKEKHKEIRNKTKRFLDFWVKQGFIKGFQEEKEGKIIAKLKIDL